MTHELGHRHTGPKHIVSVIGAWRAIDSSYWSSRRNTGHAGIKWHILWADKHLRGEGARLPLILHENVHPDGCAPIAQAHSLDARLLDRIDPRQLEASSIWCDRVREDTRCIKELQLPTGMQLCVEYISPPEPGICFCRGRCAVVHHCTRTPCNEAHSRKLTCGEEHSRSAQG